MSRTLWSTPPLSIWSGVYPLQVLPLWQSHSTELRRPPVTSETGTEYGARSVAECEREAVARSSRIGPRGGYLPSGQGGSGIWPTSGPRLHRKATILARTRLVKSVRHRLRNEPHRISSSSSSSPPCLFSSRFVIFDSETLKNIYHNN